jgi:hypothetical protein
VEENVDDNIITKHYFPGAHMEERKDLETGLIAVLKGLSHEIFGPVFWPVWMHIGLNKNRFWFLNFKEAPSI